MPEAFFVPDGDTYSATELTRGPWDPQAQHGGPPAALLAREIERLPSDVPRRVGRITYEILRPVPIARLRVDAAVIRPGRSVELIEATLRDERDDLVRARAWRLRTTELDLDGELDWDNEGSLATLRRGEAPPAPDTLPQPDLEYFPTGQSVGYHTAMDYRILAGGFNRPGPATAWVRMRYPLVAGEEPTPLERVAVAADVGSGISGPLDFTRFVFINVDITIHLAREAAGEWICLDSTTIPDRSGTGVTDTALYDEAGALGRAAQTLLLAAR